MLNSTYRLHDIDDVEAFCAHVAQLFYGRTQTRLSPSEHEDLIAYLIVETSKLSERYTPTTPQARFHSYAHSLLNHRCTDWLRLHRGRSRWSWGDGTVYERKRPTLLSLDRAAGNDPEGDPLGSTLADRSGDDEADRVARDDARLFAAADLHSAGDQAVIQAAADSWATRRTARNRESVA